MPAQQVLRIFLLLSGKTNNVVISGKAESRAQGACGFLLPRALPWAMCFCPFGACYL